MPVWLQILLACGGTAVIGQVVIMIFTMLKQKSAKYKQYQREEQQTAIREVFNTEVAPIKENLVEINNSVSILKKGTQAGLRHNLYEIYDKAKINNYCSRQDKIDFENMYENYHALGKNGVMDQIKTELMNMPEE